MSSRYPFRSLRTLVLATTILVSVGCSLPEPDGTEAAIALRAESLSPLAPSKGRSAQAVVRNGLLLNPDVRAAASKVAASADEVRVQRAVIFPSLGLSVGGGVGSAGQESSAVELTGSQLILDFGASKRAITSADIDLQINYLEFQQAVDDAIFELLQTYDSVRRYVRLLDVRKKQFSAMNELQSLVAKQTEIGAAPASDILETRKRLQAAGFLVHDTELSLGEARARLAQLSGQPKGGQISTLGRGNCSETEAADELCKAKLQLAKAQIDLEQADKARLPRAYLEPVARQKLDGGGVSVGFNLGVNSDLLQGGALSARANAARNARDGADAGIAVARRDLAFDITSLRREIAGAERKVTLLNNQIALLVETRSLFRSQYFELGTREVADLLDNEEEYYNRRAKLVELDSELATNRVACAVQARVLRKSIGIEGSSLYGYPLGTDAF
jgi:adhesin transport system outer membrane protein